MTIAICSYQRREALIRLLRSLADQAANSPADWQGIDVLVVIDGSTDGSAEAANAVSMPIPHAVVSQRNLGLSTARNECLARASGDLIYFLDDDLVPAEGTVHRHRAADRAGPAPVVLGPCTIPDSFPAPDGARAWFAQRYAELERTEFITRFDRFSIANASGPTEAFRAVGGFDTSFVGYGLEDYEIGLRLMAAGVYERFDSDALAWHYSTVDERSTVVRNREAGRNAVRLLRRHPEATAALFPERYAGPAPWLVDHIALRRATWLGTVARASQWGGLRLAPTSQRAADLLLAVAAAASHSAGVSDLDPSLVGQFLGRPEGPTTGILWRRRPSHPIKDTR